MAKPTTRTEFSEYCLRRLGKPVININVAQEQVEDRIDEAIEVYQEKHFDATEEMWTVYPLTQEDIDNGYITVPEDVLSVVEILPNGLLSGGSASSGMFSFQYQIMSNQLSPWQPFDRLDYFLKMTDLEETRQLLDPDPRFRYVRHESKVKIYRKGEFEVGYPVVMRIFKFVDPESVWNDKWLKSYATALIKRQWGENTSKFQNIQLLGGVTINGEKLFADALQEIERLEEQLDTVYQEPVGFIIG